MDLGGLQQQMHFQTIRAKGKSSEAVAVNELTEDSICDYYLYLLPRIKRKQWGNNPCPAP